MPNRMYAGLIVAGCMWITLNVTDSLAWNYEGHRMVAAAAVASLPEDFPAFARNPTASERIQFLSGDPDRWRILRDPAFRHINDPDHYFDLESMAEYNLTPKTLPDLRNELLGHIYIERIQHPEKFVIADESDDARVYLLFGLLPYSIQDYFLKLKAEFIYYRDMKNKGSTPEDLAQAEQNIIYTMGVMSHFVGDGAQPLHLSVHHHGWVGDNPEGYTSSRKIHSWIDGGFIEAAQITYDSFKDRIQPAEIIWPGDTVPHEISAFPSIMEYLVESHRRVEPLYQLEKNGKLNGDKPSPEGCRFIEDQLLRGSHYLGSLYYSAFKSAEMVPLAPAYSPAPESPAASNDVEVISSEP